MRVENKLFCATSTVSKSATPFSVAHLGDAERLFGGRKARSRDLRLLFEQLNVAERDLDFIESD